MFEHILPGPSDPMFWLKKRADADTSPEKVDVGVGIYRNEQGKYQELEVVREVNLSRLHTFDVRAADIFIGQEETRKARSRTRRRSILKLSNVFIGFAHHLETV